MGRLHLRLIISLLRKYKGNSAFTFDKIQTRNQKMKYQDFHHAGFFPIVVTSALSDYLCFSSSAQNSVTAQNCEGARPDEYMRHMGPVGNGRILEAT